MTDSPLRHAFRWRLIPATIMGLFGCAILAAWLFVIFALVRDGRAHLLADWEIWRSLLAMVCSACCWIAAGCCAWRGRWRTMAALILMGYLIGFLGSLWLDTVQPAPSPTSPTAG
jgi:hypothetical protein